MLTSLYQLTIMPIELMMEVLFTILYRMLDCALPAVIGLGIAVSFLMLPLWRRAEAARRTLREEAAGRARASNCTETVRRASREDAVGGVDASDCVECEILGGESAHREICVVYAGLTMIHAAGLVALCRYLSGLHVVRGFSFGFLTGWRAALCLTCIVYAVFFLARFILRRLLRDPERVFAVCLSVSGVVFAALITGRLHGLRGKAVVAVLALTLQIPLVRRLLCGAEPDPGQLSGRCCSRPELTAGTGSFLRWLSGRRLSHPGRLSERASSMKHFLIKRNNHLALFLQRYFPSFSSALVRKGRQDVYEAAGNRPEGVYAAAAETRRTGVLFILGGVVLTLLAGVLIPLSVLSSSPTEFIRVEAYVSPLRFVRINVLTAAGFFLLWGGVLFLVCSGRKRRFLTLILWILSVCSLVNYMFFSKNFGDLSSDLSFDQYVGFGRPYMALNAEVMVLLALLLSVVWKFRRGAVKSVYLILIVVILALSAQSVKIMNRIIAKIPDLVPVSEAVEPDESEPVFRLSRTGKNVIVLMMDRMVSSYVPYILNEKPWLKEKFSGFTWYPNTLSFGVCTNYGSPALFGGYEYTPLNMNKRSEEPLADKQNELLKVMPVLFSRSGYEVTVCDPPYAGYQGIPDLSIYDGYPGIRACNLTHTGAYSQELREQFGEYFEQEQQRNFIFYSIFRMVPSALQKSVYDSGRYLSCAKRANVKQKFMNNYGALCHLKDMTQVTDEDQDTFLMMTNKTTHESTSLQMPDYEPALSVSNRAYMDPALYTLNGVTMKMETTRQRRHYYVNMATFLKLGDWFDYMREEGVYDNTRIIIVADHGALDMKQFERLEMDIVSVMAFNPILMVKDFGASDFSSDGTFMTNGDTPSLAMKDLIENPVNPFTGQEINMDAKYAGPQVVTTSRNWRVAKNHGNVYDSSDGEWLSVHDDIFREENWAKAE